MSPTLREALTAGLYIVVIVSGLYAVINYKRLGGQAADYNNKIYRGVFDREMGTIHMRLYTVGYLVVGLGATVGGLLLLWKVLQ